MYINDANVLSKYKFVLSTYKFVNLWLNAEYKTAFILRAYKYTTTLSFDFGTEVLNYATTLSLPHQYYIMHF